MNRRILSKLNFSTVASLAILTGSFILVYAVVSQVAHDGYGIGITKKPEFEISVNKDGVPTELSRGESFSVSPWIKSESSDNLYVFMTIGSEKCSGDFIYTYDVDSSWVKIDETDDYTVYGYGTASSLTEVTPGEKTLALTTSMTLRSNISIEDYAAISDMTVSINGYAVLESEADSDPAQAWEEAKQYIQ